MNAGIIQNVVTYNTTIEFDNPECEAVSWDDRVRVDPVAWANDVVKIPNGALRFKPDLTDSERQALYAKYGIKENARGTAAGRIGSASGGQGAAAADRGVRDEARVAELAGRKVAVMPAAGRGQNRRAGGRGE